MFIIEKFSYSHIGESNHLYIYKYCVRDENLPSTGMFFYFLPGPRLLTWDNFAQVWISNHMPQ